MDYFAYNTKMRHTVLAAAAKLKVLVCTATVEISAKIRINNVFSNQFCDALSETSIMSDKL